MRFCHTLVAVYGEFCNIRGRGPTNISQLLFELCYVPNFAADSTILQLVMEYNVTTVDLTLEFHFLGTGQQLTSSAMITMQDEKFLCTRPICL